MIRFIKEHCYTVRGKINPNINQMSWWIKRGFQSQHAEIIKLTSFLPINASYKRRFYHILHNTYTIPLCDYCVQNPVNWYADARYLTYCSTSCSATATVSMREESSMKKYGVTNPSKCQTIKNKIKDTTLKNYGVTNYALSKEFSDFMITMWREKPVEDRYEIQKKRENTCLIEYGKITPLLNKTVQEKIKNSLQEHYGIDSPLQSNEIKETRRKTMLVRFRREECNQQHLTTETINNLKDKGWIEEQLISQSIRQLAVVTGLSFSHLCKIVNKHGLMSTKYSSFHKEIADYIITLGIVDLIVNDRSVLFGKELDILIPSANLAIECNGVYWHSELSGKKHRTYHLNKTNEVTEKGLQLLHIYDSEWYDPIKQNIIKSKISYLLKTGHTKIYARTCHCRKIDKLQERQFLNLYHLQGYANSTVCYGLFDSTNQLVSLMSFTTPRFNKLFDWELLRYCSKSFTSVSGGFSKMFSCFVNENSPKSIISYSDRRWSIGKIYSTCGFMLRSISPPAHFYHLSDQILQNRLKYQKHKLSQILESFDPKLTAWENMQNNGYDRIWDCGNLVYEWIKK